MTYVPDFDSFTSLAAAFYDISERLPERPLYSQAVVNDDPEDFVTERKWSSRTFGEVRERVKKIAHYMKSIGVVKESKVAIISSSRPEWMEADLAAHSIGAIVVSVYQSLPTDDIGYILYDSDAGVVFAENQEQVDKLLELLQAPINIPETEERNSTTAQIGIKKIISFESVNEHPLVKQLDVILGGADTDELDDYKSLSRDDMAAFVYTSGTTGPPKGVMQTHGNHLANVRQAYGCKLVHEQSILMVFLPLAHSFAKLMGYLGFIGPAELRFMAVLDKQSSKLNPDSATKDIREAGATIIPVVPRLLEKMQAGVLATGRGGGVKGFLVGNTLWAAQAVYDKSPSLLAPFVYSLTGFMRKKVSKMLFGAKLDYLISGGAKLNPQTARFFDMLGIEILEGYGLTETCVAVNVNLSGRAKIGTVGPLLADDIEQKITEDGEICYKGPNITQGYYKREQATKASWDDEGWFHTGDLGEVDEDGYLSIVGRKKDIIVTSYGKNIAPEDIEAQMKSSLYISQVVLIGEGRPFIAALVSIDLQAVKTWAKKQGMTEQDLEALAKSDRVKARIWEEIEKVNEDLAHHESVKKIELVPEDFTVENGMMTPTFKVKRPVVTKVYADLIELMYQM